MPLSSKGEAVAMNELWQIVAELGLELHPDRVAAIASKIESLGSVEQFALVKPVFGPNADKSMIGRLTPPGVKPTRCVQASCCGLARGFTTAALHERHGSVEMVWTGPSTGMVPVRHTEQVLCEVIIRTQPPFVVSFCRIRGVIDNQGTAGCGRPSGPGGHPYGNPRPTVAER